MSLTIRGYHHGDEHKILEMFNEVFHQNRELSHWYWKYRDNPYGSYFISIAETPERILAAHYAGYPVPIVYCYGSGQYEAFAYHMGDKMTRKKYRALGFGKNSILIQTAEHFYSTFPNEKTSFSYGFVTASSRKLGLLFLKYKTIEPIQYRVLEISNKKEVLSFVSRVKGLRVLKESSIDSEWDDFFKSVVDDYHFLIKRDTQYLKWRYLLRPDKTYQLFSFRKRGRLVGWSVFEDKGDTLLWGDALFKRDVMKDLEYFLSCVVGMFDNRKIKRIKRIEGWFSKNPQWWDNALRNNGFLDMREPSDIYFTIRNFTDERIPDRLKKLFYYTYGDSDLF